MTIIYEPIGIIRTTFKEREGMPIQTNGAKGLKGEVVLKEEFQAGVTDLEGFSHIILIYHFHKSQNFKLMVTPFLDSMARGVFSTRAPLRPNSIGLSIVKLLSIEGNVLHVENVDMIDNTPLLDIKPYIPQFDCVEADRIGWIQKRIDEASELKSDNRFKG
jgi:tRNA-Thr(GGU) m(6)t(6)A37 methyltransferase TsaA